MLKSFCRSLARLILGIALCSTMPAFSAITYFASTHNPADNAPLDDSVPRWVTPPPNMQAGDLIYVIAGVRSSSALLSMTNAGGQSWTAQTQRPIAGSGQMRVFHTRFNGTWGGNVAVATDTRGGVPLTLIMLVFRPTNGLNTWAVNGPQADGGFAAPASPFDVTSSGQITTATSTVTITAFASVDDNSWALQTAGWSNPAGKAQFRNTAGNQTSLSIAYKIQNSSDDTGTVTNRQTSNGGDNGHWLTQTFAEVPAAVAKKWHPGHYMLLFMGETAAGRLQRWASIENEPQVVGGEFRYRWFDLETSPGVYDFSAIEADLNALKAHDKRLIIAIEDRIFNSSNASGFVPPYIQNMGGPNMGIAETKNGFIARIWEKPIMDRLIALNEALAARFDAETHFEAIHGEESVPGFGSVTPPAGYSHLKLRDELTRLGAAMALAWPRTNTAQFFNWLGGGATAHTAFIQGMDQNNMGFGGPDIFGTAGATLTDGQDAYIGVIGGVDYRGRMPCIHNVQNPELGGSLGDYTPQQIFNVANNTLHCSHVSWIRNTLSDDPAQNWGNGTGTGILWMIRNNALTHINCPSNYTQGCDTSDGSPLTVQFETATVAANTDSYTVRTAPSDVLFQASTVGDSITFSVPNVAAGTYAIAVTVQKGPNRGIFQLESSTSLGGTYTAHGAPQNTYDPAFVGNQTLTLSPTTTFAASGTRYFRLRLTGTSGSGHFLAIDRMTLAP